MRGFAILVLLAACAALAAAQVTPNKVCVPDKFHWVTIGGFEAKNSTNGMAMQLEFYDYGKQFFRTREAIMEKSTDMFYEAIYFGERQRLYEVYGVKGGGSINCTVHSVKMTIRHPCLSNARLRRRAFLGGDSVVTAWFDKVNTTNRGPVAEDWEITAWTHNPVRRHAYYFQYQEFVWENFYDFGLEVPAEEYVVPGICPSGVDATPMPEELSRRMMRLLW
jgi:hypothetical protein